MIELSCSAWLSVAADENASIQTNERPRTIYLHIRSACIVWGIRLFNRSWVVDLLVGYVIITLLPSLLTLWLCFSLTHSLLFRHGICWAHVGCFLSGWFRHHGNRARLERTYVLSIIENAFSYYVPSLCVPTNSPYWSRAIFSFLYSSLCMPSC